MPIASAPDTKVIPDAAQEIEVHVCLVCGLAGKRGGPSAMNLSCEGPRDDRHKRTRMALVRYEAKEVVTG